MAKGLTGKQGVIIPEANVKNLMLKKEVLEAVKEGRFHVYRAETVEEGIEILTGVAAGKPDRRGVYPPKTVFGLVQRKLKQYLQQSMRLRKGNGDKGARPALQDEGF
jgi:predicted ATP-dependent protease